MRFGNLPVPPEHATVPYALDRPELKSLSLGEQARLITETQAWASIMVPRLDALDEGRPRRGPAPAYTSHELERAVLFMVIAGKDRWCHARTVLAGDRQAASRAALGFDVPRVRYGRPRTVVASMDGVPSEATMWRHQARWGVAEHRDTYRALFEALLAEHLTEFPEFREELRILNIDGTVVRSHYTSFNRPVKRRKNARPGKSPGPVTGQGSAAAARAASLTKLAPPTLQGGGYVPRTDGNEGKAGHGHKIVAVTTSRGLPVAARVAPIQQGENLLAVQLMNSDFARVVKPHILDNGVGVICGDAAYTGREPRLAFREQGYAEVVHGVSHGDHPRSRANARKHDRIKRTIVTNPNWSLNGHHELTCACGNGNVVKRITGGPVTGVKVGTEGQCDTCGNITITAGKWRLISERTRVARVLPGQTADERLGNPLVFDNAIAKAYGHARFGHNEGFHGHLATRFGVINGKKWFRTAEAVELRTLQVFSVMHALAMEQRRREHGGRDGGGGRDGNGGRVRSLTRPGGTPGGGSEPLPLAA